MAIDEDAGPEAVDFEVGTAPVLVRPYVGEYTLPDTGRGADPDGPGDAPPAPAPRGPSRVLRAVRRHRGVVLAGRHARRSGGRGPWLALIGASGATAAILTVGAVLIAGTGGPVSPDVSGRLQASAPGASRPAPGMPGGSGRPGSPQPGTAGAPLPVPSAAGNAGTDPAPQPPGGPAQSTDPVPTELSGTANPTSPAAQPDPPPPPPAVAVTGRITNVSGLCLNAGGDQDSGIRLSGCDGSAGQSWTLATDGTVRTLGQCLQSGGSTVRLRSCNAGLAQQWRAGAALSLVNSASATCLGDPLAGTSSGTVQRTAPCDQSDAQRWTLPLAG